VRNSNSTYRHFIPQIDLYLERNTSRVPNDGKYYISYKGQIIESFRSPKKAEEKLKQLIAESGYKPEGAISKPNEIDEAMDRYFFLKELYWSESHKYRVKGGKGR